MSWPATSSTCCAYAAGHSGWPPSGGCCRSPWPSAWLRLVSTGLARDTVIIGLASHNCPWDPPAGAARRRVLKTPFGSFFLASAPSVSFGGPIVAVALLLTKKDPRLTTLLLLIFVAVAVATALLATRPQPPRVVSILRRNLHSSAQLPVRVSLLLILLLVYLATSSASTFCSALFAAGIVVRLFTEGSKAQSCAASSKPSGTVLGPDLLHRERDALRPQVFDGPAERAAACPLFLRLMWSCAALLPSCSTERCCRATNGCRSPSSRRRPCDHRRHHRHRDRRGQDPPENASALVAAGILSVLLSAALGSVGCAHALCVRPRRRRPMRMHRAALDRHAPPDALGAP